MSGFPFITLFILISSLMALMLAAAGLFFAQEPVLISQPDQAAGFQAPEQSGMDVPAARFGLCGTAPISQIVACRVFKT